MANIIFITIDYTPVSNGTITCLENIIPYISQKHNVTIYTNRVDRLSLLQEYINGVKVKRPYSKFDNQNFIKSKLIKKIMIMPFNSAIKQIITFLVRICFVPSTLLARKYGYQNHQSWENNLYKLLVKNEELCKFDCIMAVGNPFTNIRCAIEIKRHFPHLKLIFLQFDLFAYNPEYLKNDDKTRNVFQERLAEELKWYEISDNIVSTKEMFEVIKNSDLSKYSSKIISLGMPSLTRHDSNSLKNVFYDTRDKVNIVYTGMFYEDIRNPEFMLKVFSHIVSRNANVTLHIVGYGCENEIERYKVIMGDNLVVYGHKDRQFAANARYSADILINVSNRTSSQAPSKIIEYIGACKPIINLYTIENDICSEILSKYPLSISIREDSSRLNEIIIDIETFIERNKGKSVKYENVERSYFDYLPQSYAAKIIELIEA